MPHPTTSGTPIGHDDYALERVPAGARYSWMTVAVQRFGQLSALSQFLLGATLGLGMTFWDAVLAITLGAIILEVVAIFVGIAGMREGMSTSVLARWTGFGRMGSGLIGLVLAIALIGWFGVQNAVFADGLKSLLGGPPVWVWAIVAGLAVIVIVVYGFASMAWTAYITVPAFLALAGWSISVELSRHPLGDLVASDPAGVILTIPAATTLVAGGFIVGAVITPDMTRFNRSVGDVVKQTLVGITLGEYVIALIGVLLAHALRTGDVTQIVSTTSGAIGTLILIASTLKVNDWNLYSSSLGIVTMIDSVLGVRVNRVLVTVVFGAVGTVLSAVGILSRFIDFLVLLSVAVTPVAAIMVAEYFVVRRWRPILAASRESGRLPEHAPTWVPATLAVWLAAFLIGYYVEWGIPALNALVFAFVAYAALGRLGLIRGIGEPRVLAVSAA
ncbi:purine-cytosine permease family protein [Rhizohabitans arisaemae]|uniref:purine-cytosine permease family protein n=1 Tax=Rhizohabitans arisaemae TaxID=2720610 RepID=UPI0024B0A8CD|nr:cytosine permease [Rhizohabitans arisaemae]